METRRDLFLILSRIANEEEAKTLESDIEFVEFFMESLKGALMSKDHTYKYYSIKNLINALESLANCSEHMGNKISTRGILNFLEKVIVGQNFNVEDVQAALQLIWVLYYNKEVSPSILKKTSLIEGNKIYDSISNSNSSRVEILKNY